MTLKKLSNTINSTKVSFCCSNEQFRGEVVGYSTASSCNPGIESSNRTEGHYLFLVRLFFILNSSMSSLVYIFAKLFPYTLPTMQSKEESKSSGHPTD